MDPKKKGNKIGKHPQLFKSNRYHQKIVINQILDISPKKVQPIIAVFFMKFHYRSRNSKCQYLLRNKLFR